MEPQKEQDPKAQIDLHIPYRISGHDFSVQAVFEQGLLGSQGIVVGSQRGPVDCATDQTISHVSCGMASEPETGQQMIDRDEMGLAEYPSVLFTTLPVGRAALRWRLTCIIIL